MSCSAKHRMDYIACEIVSPEDHETHWWEGEIPGRDGTWSVEWQLKPDGRIQYSHAEQVKTPDEDLTPVSIIEPVADDDEETLD